MTSNGMATTTTNHPAVKRARYEDSNNHSNHNNSNSGGGPNSSSWTLPNSPGQLSISSLSPPPFINGHSMGTTNGLSPSSSYDSFSPRGKEDMSPPNSVNGYNGVDSFGDPKKKKGPAPRQQEELCLVCGDRASGYHYNALTCEGCKGFFRRSITKNAVYQCKYGNSCEIDMYMRRKCQECRLKKCLTVGMRPECVVPEYQCAIKRESKRAQKEGKDKPNSTTSKQDNSISSLSSPDKDEKPCIRTLHANMNGGHASSNSSSLHHNNLNNNNVNHGNNMIAGTGGGMHNTTLNGLNHGVNHSILGNNNGSNIMNRGVKPLTDHQKATIQKLVYYQEEFESPSEKDIEQITPFSLGESEDDGLKRFQHVTEMTILTVQLIVEFSKRVPGFDTLLREDQITLLKACSSEVMMLRCSRKYDIKTDSIVYANNQPYTRENYRSASIGEFADALFNFCRSTCVLKVDNAEYSLLTAIIIFSERPHLRQPQNIEKIQEFYLDALRAYVENHRPAGKCYFAKLLAILTELRSLGNVNSEVCFSLKVQNKRLPPFLAEIWDLDQNAS